jgi:hypothetical protein
MASGTAIVAAETTVDCRPRASNAQGLLGVLEDEVPPLTEPPLGLQGFDGDRGDEDVPPLRDCPQLLEVTSASTQAMLQAALRASAAILPLDDVFT